MKVPERVAGDSIGGLMAAVMLRRVGFEVAVFERAAGLEAVGARLLLAANVVKAQGKLGLSGVLEEIWVPAHGDTGGRGVRGLDTSPLGGCWPRRITQMDDA